MELRDLAKTGSLVGFGKLNFGHKRLILPVFLIFFPFGEGRRPNRASLVTFGTFLAFAFCVGQRSTRTANSGVWTRMVWASYGIERSLLGRSQGGARLAVCAEEWREPIMNVSLTPDLEDLVHQTVRSGRYSTASEVIRAALRLFEAHEAVLRAQTAYHLAATTDASSRTAPGGLLCRAGNTAVSSSHAI